MTYLGCQPSPRTPADYVRYPSVHFNAAGLLRPGLAISGHSALGSVLAQGGANGVESVAGLDRFQWLECTVIRIRAGML